jgi:hypothetical protein
MNSPPTKTLTNHEVVLFAVYLLGGETSPIETEDIAVKVNELAPRRIHVEEVPQPNKLGNRQGSSVEPQKV